MVAMVFGHLKTSQGGHQLTNELLQKLFSDESNWKFQTFEEKDPEVNRYITPVAVNQ